VIMVADRLLTRTVSRGMVPYEFESVEPKIYSRDNVVVGFAGSELWAQPIRSSIEESEKKDFDKVVELVSQWVRQKREKIICDEIRRRTGVGHDEFFKNSNLPIPTGVREMI